MPSMFLLPERVARQDGAGEEVALETNRGRPLLVTLGITRIVEQESLEVAIWGSADKRTWRSLQTFPQKFYCGTYHLLLNLSGCPEIRHIRAQWRVKRWGRGETTPLFAFYLFAEEALVQAAGAA